MGIGCWLVSMTTKKRRRSTSGSRQHCQWSVVTSKPDTTPVDSLFHDLPPTYDGNNTVVDRQMRSNRSIFESLKKLQCRYRQSLLVLVFLIFIWGCSNCYHRHLIYRVSSPSLTCFLLWLPLIHFDIKLVRCFTFFHPCMLLCFLLQLLCEKQDRTAWRNSWILASL